MDYSNITYQQTTSINLTLIFFSNSVKRRSI